MCARVAFGVLVACVGEATAQTTVILPDTSLTTGITVNIMEQATVTIPSSVQFVVSNINSLTTSGTLAVSVQNLFLKSTTTAVTLGLRATASNFTAPQAGAPSWSASDVSWLAGTWTGGTGQSGTLDSASFNRVASCGTSGCSTSSLTFRLAPRSTVSRAGAHRLLVTWKIETLQ